jgi:GNAT superfamily N-acetyltransferase
MKMDKVKIVKVESRKDLRKFIKFPWEIYKDEPNWVPPLIYDLKAKLNRKKNPFFEHAEMELFLALRNDETTGRIAAIVDENHNQFHEEKIVFFGLYESLNDLDTAKSLLDNVAAWGKERGMDALRGPVNLSMNDECAFLIEGFDSPPVIMMPYNHPYYLELMEKCGLRKAKDLFAFYMTKDHKTAEKVQEIAKKIREVTDITLRALERKTVDKEAEKVKFIYNHAWEKNWGFVPWTEKEMSYMISKLKMIADFSLVILAEEKGKPVGFIFGLPNYNEVFKRMNGRITPFGIFKFFFYRKKIKGMRGIVFGVLKEYRMTGLSYLLYSELEKNAQAKGYEWAETSWQLEDNDAINKFIASVGGEVYKKYRIYEKSVA